MPTYKTFAGRFPARHLVYLLRYVWKKDKRAHQPYLSEWKLSFGEDEHGRPILVISRDECPDITIRLQEKQDEIGNQQAAV